MRAYMTDAPLPLNPRNKIIPDSKKTCACPVPRKVITRDSNMARRTHVATYFGSEYSTLREVDDLKVSIIPMKRSRRNWSAYTLDLPGPPRMAPMKSKYFCSPVIMLRQIRLAILRPE